MKSETMKTLAEYIHDMRTREHIRDQLIENSRATDADTNGVNHDVALVDGTLQS